MDKHARVNVYEEDAVRVTASLEAFDGDVQKWKLMVYEVFRYQMTWDFAHRIDLRDYRDGGVYIIILCKPAYEKNIINTMKDLGFADVKAEHENVGVIECTDLPDDMLYDYVYTDY